jgi:transmembrane 9 superfamily protein 2/4
MKRDVYCQPLCVVRNNNNAKEQEAASLGNAIHNMYHHNWILDGMNFASKVEDDASVTTRYWQGFPIGFFSFEHLVDKSSASPPLYYVHNHVNIEIMYNQVMHNQVGNDHRYNVVRVTVEPFSIQHTFVDQEPESGPIDVLTTIASCTREDTHTRYDMVTDIGRKPQPATASDILYTYDVMWAENVELKWSDRWEVYLTMDHAIPEKVHYISIANSMVVLTIVFGILLAV